MNEALRTVFEKAGAVFCIRKTALLFCDTALGELNGSFGAQQRACTRLW